MDRQSNAKMVTRLLFRLLPIQILLAAVGAVNGIVSSYFASNYVGVAAMSAVGLYSPLNMLVSSISTILVGGSAILCGKYMGRNQLDRMQSIFSLDLILCAVVSIVFTAVYAVMGALDLTGFLTKDPVVRPIFDRYLLGQALGVIPLIFGNSFSAFLAIENKQGRTTAASLIYILVNVVLNFLFVQLLHWEAFGLALASALGMWVFFLVQAQVFLSGKTLLRIRFSRPKWGEAGQIVRVGVPGAASYVYQTARGLIVNRLLEAFVGSVGISAFAASNNLLGIVWAIPGGMLAVSRLMISVSLGEEDRQTLTDVMRVMFSRFLPLMGAVCAAIIFSAHPLTRIFYRDEAQPARAPQPRRDLAQMRTNDPSQLSTNGEQKSRQPFRADKKVGRNDPCPCGSGLKYKNCHGKGLV